MDLLPFIMSIQYHFMYCEWPAINMTAKIGGNLLLVYSRFSAGGNVAIKGGTHTI